ncbi:MAG: 4Fe-4S dicluster domain-containing protein [Ignavibacteriaceae bacterium]
MKKQSRRHFFKTAGLLTATITAVSTKPAKAGPENILSNDRMGVLVDTTACIGCRNCEWACRKAHDLPAGNIDSYEDKSVFKQMRRPDKSALTVINQYENTKQINSPINVKTQCMHCDHPACVSACIVGAFSKKENGSVVWDTDKCIGCRYCMVACPFQVPSFEYDKALDPLIQKCDLCFERTKEGLLPACVDICPVEAMTYAPRSELIKIARERIKRYPEKYINHIYGETEVGGTSWLYIAGQDLVKSKAMPKLGTKPAPGVSESIQHGIFAYFVPPASLYALLAGIMWLGKKKKESGEEK